jgi:hypothetical protein
MLVKTIRAARLSGRPRRSRIVPLACCSMALAITCVGLAACGGSGDAVAHVGAHAIMKSEVSHWMGTLAGGDYNEVSHGHTVPAGLVSDPANYPRCVRSLQTTAATAKTSSGPPTPTSAQLSVKCRQLYEALRQQAAAYVVNAQWVVRVDSEGGATASHAQVMQRLQRVKKAEFDRPGQFERYLASTRRTVADELVVLKLDLLSEKLQAKLGTTNDKQQLINTLTEAGEAWTGKTSCQPGYVVEHCKQYISTPSRPDSPSPAVLMEQVATIAGHRCNNREACG